MGNVNDWEVEMAQRTFSDSPYEQQFGYCRAIRVGNQIIVSGTIGIENGELVGIGDAYQQTLVAFKNIEKALLDLGSNLDDLVRVRIYITDPSNIEAIGKAAHESDFKNIQPAATLVVVNGLIDPRVLVEIEAEAIV
jgi:enamine deaminase RidA (YjgF/YER057c/UK114 family)